MTDWQKRRILSFFLGVFLCVSLISFLAMKGCSGTVKTEGAIAEGIVAFDRGAHLVGIENKVTRIADYAAALHEAGVDSAILEDIHRAVSVAHEVAESHAANSDVELME